MAHGLKKKEINDREHGTFVVLKDCKKPMLGSKETLFQKNASLCVSNPFLRKPRFFFSLLLRSIFFRFAQAAQAFFFLFVADRLQKLSPKFKKASFSKVS